MNKIEGYKSFNKGLITNYNDVLEVGKKYTIAGEIKYHQNGYHFCKHLEDTLRYCDAMNEEVDICKVIGSGDIDEGYDDYYGYYYLYAASELEIVKKLTREEIMDIMIDPINVPDLRIKRFIEGYKLTNDEIERIISVYPSSLVKEVIDYYQRGDKDVFIKSRK